MFDTQHHSRPYKKLLQKWFGPFVIKKYLEIMDLMSLKILMAHHIQIVLIVQIEKGFRYVIPRTKSIMSLKVM
jgi:hypothetical protein